MEGSQVTSQSGEKVQFMLHVFLMALEFQTEIIHLIEMNSNFATVQNEEQLSKMLFNISNVIKKQFTHIYTYIINVNFTCIQSLCGSHFLSNCSWIGQLL